MLAIQADENGRPVVIESVPTDGGKATFRDVTPERWQEIVREGIGDAPPRSIIPVQSWMPDPEMVKRSLETFERGDHQTTEEIIAELKASEERWA